MSKKNQTVSSEPWAPAQPFLQSGLGQAQDFYEAGRFAPEVYGGPRVAEFSGDTNQSFDMIRNAASGPQVSGTASGFLTGQMTPSEGNVGAARGYFGRMMNPERGNFDAAQGYFGNMMDGDYQSSRLDAVKSNALDSAIPAAAAMFSGSGMANSSAAMDGVGRAAMDAVAPYEYQAFNAMQDRGMAAAGQAYGNYNAALNRGMSAAGQEYGAYDAAQGRGLSAAGMAPTIDRAGYLPGMMMGTVGAQQDQNAQARLDADRMAFNENAARDSMNFNNYISTIMGLGGMGGQTSQPVPGGSPMERLAAGGLTGVGTYGSLAGALGASNPATAPLAIGAGILGMF